MCRSRSEDSVAIQALGRAADESQSFPTVAASAQHWARADFALQLVCLFLLLIPIAAAAYCAYKQRRETQQSRRSFSTQTDPEIGTREELERVARSVSALQNQILTLELERDSERRLASLRRSRSTSHDQLLQQAERTETAGYEME